MSSAAEVAIVGSGGANIASLDFALRRLGARARLTVDADEIRNASHVILPGVGAAADAMHRLRALGLEDTLTALEQPVLGICLGMQLFAARSEEDDAVCLGVLPPTVFRLPAGPGTTVPHMGWNRVWATGGSKLLAGVEDGAHFYFLHSYALPPDESTRGRTEHGAAFSAVVEHGNYYGTQFHPERSSANGARLLANFLALES